MISEFWRGTTQAAAWGIAAAWCVHVSKAMDKLPGIANLIGLEWDVWPEGMPSLTVIVPGKDEAANIAATLDTLVAQQYTNLRVVAVDDRSTDATGEIMEQYAARYPQRIAVLHVTEMPRGWLGKTNAMAQGLMVEALGASASEYVLFTDADVLFSPSVLRRSLAYAVSERADHLVTLPTMQVKTWGEGVLMGFFQIFGVWVSRPWKVSDPLAKRDVVGVGAFNLVRRDALERIGGLEPQRLAVLEDVTLARRMKAAGMRQRVAFAPGLVLVHWAKGARGLVQVMSKNLFSAFNFRPLLAMAAGLWVVVFCLVPFAGLAWWATVVPALLVMACLTMVYRMYGQVSWVPAKYGWAFPLGAVMFCYALVRSVVVVWKDGGVKWRGTLYPLRELRRHNSPFQWKRRGRGREPG
jgi:glycosyltransferase involved in cell wall biosynthesis